MDVVFSQLAQAKLNSPEEIQLLREAHQLDPSNGNIIKRLARRLVDFPELAGPVVDEMRREKSISSAVFLKSAELHFRAREYENTIECNQYATEVDEKCAEAYNNIAWIRANVPPVDMQQALDAVDKAIELEPKAEFFETRGQIYFKTDELQLAVQDLERAVNGKLPAVDIMNSHFTLAKIYQQLGNSEKATAHESRAKNIRMRIRS